MAKDSELNAYQLCLGNTLKSFAPNNMKEMGLNGYVYDFSADYFSTDVDNMLDIYKYLMIKVIQNNVQTY